MWKRWYERLPMAPDGGAGTGGGAGAGAGGGAGGGDAPAARPEFVPEKFWDGSKGEVRLQDAFKSYSEMERLVGKRATELDADDFKALVAARVEQDKPNIVKAALVEKLGEAPEKADGYKLELPEDLAKDLPEEARDISGLADDPLVGWWREFAHSLGAGQDFFARGIAGYMKAVSDFRAQAHEAEMKALGETAGARTEAARLYLSKHLSQEQYEALAPALSTAGAFQAIEALIDKAKSGAAALPGTGSGNQVPSGVKSAAELKKMMDDPRYYDPRKRDEAYVAEIDAGWKKLLPGQVNLAGGIR